MLSYLSAISYVSPIAFVFVPKCVRACVCIHGVFIDILVNWLHFFWCKDMSIFVHVTLIIPAFPLQVFTAKAPPLGLTAEGLPRATHPGVSPPATWNMVLFLVLRMVVL